ncbi:TetR family transcriptional regulator [Krasilnikovia cinnamomea]|uniref:TetR family transcriptional regulator n=1 Tax=Krasilnikovia cinnamomea TaxID=349313 RepID=A0A4Q7ZN13_9ACTN|nr:TetR/AcrR family transcriptional regulator [Krasilnikovia cinnamomea]RZU51823.1 TetR family transcriptional regulator [Krasilnikovia cinnamomea]
MARTAEPGRRDAILDAAHTVFARKGYTAASIADLAGELGIGHGTVYRYFGNKRDVASAVLDRALARIAEVVAAELPDATGTLAEYRAQVWRIGHRLYELFAADPALGRLVFFDLATVDDDLRGRHREALDRFADFTAAYLRNGVDRGFLRPDLDVEVTARVVNGMVFEGAAQVARDPAALELRDAWIRAVVTLMFDGLAAPTP